MLQPGDARGRDAVRFQDFAPFLVTTESSLAALNAAIASSPASKKAGFLEGYPMKPFRPSIVLSGAGAGRREPSLIERPSWMESRRETASCRHLATSSTPCTWNAASHRGR